MIKKILICAGMLTLVGCGGVSVDQKALAATNEQCQQNGGIYSVNFSEGEYFSLDRIYVNCKDGSIVMLETGKDW